MASFTIVPLLSLWNFFLTYFAQGAVISFLTGMLTVYLQQQGLENDLIGSLITAALIPYALKIFFGLLSDKYSMFGFYRKPHIVIGAVVEAIFLFVIVFIPVKYYAAVALCYVLSFAAMGAVDTATDGWAIDMVENEDQEGLVQSVMVSGRAIGLIVVSVVLGLLAEYTSWVVVFAVVGGLCVTPFLGVFSVEEKGQATARDYSKESFMVFTDWRVLSSMLSGFLGFGLIFGLGVFYVAFLVSDLSISLSLGGYISAVRGAGQFVGALTSRFAFKRFSHRVVYPVACTLLMGSLMIQAAVSDTSWMWVFAVLFGFGDGLYQSSFFAQCMNLCRKDIGATQFAVMMVPANVGVAAASPVIGFLTKVLGYRTTFLLAPLAFFLQVPLLYGAFWSRYARQKATETPIEVIPINPV